jgi:hypothetical protein
MLSLEPLRIALESWRLALEPLRIIMEPWRLTAVEACPGAIESLSRPVEAHMESILAQMGASGTIGSHPDEDYSIRSYLEWAYMALTWTYIAPWRVVLHARMCPCDPEDQIMPQRLLLQQWQLPSWC